MSCEVRLHLQTARRNPAKNTHTHTLYSSCPSQRDNGAIDAVVIFHLLLSAVVCVCVCVCVCVTLWCSIDQSEKSEKSVENSRVAVVCRIDFLAKMVLEKAGDCDCSFERPFEIFT